MDQLPSCLTLTQHNNNKNMKKSMHITFLISSTLAWFLCFISLLYAASSPFMFDMAALFLGEINLTFRTLFTIFILLIAGIFYGIAKHSVICVTLACLILGCVSYEINSPRFFIFFTAPSIIVFIIPHVLKYIDFRSNKP